jgi:hypothetical protein
MINGNACFTYLNKNWGIPPSGAWTILTKAAGVALPSQATPERGLIRPITRSRIIACLNPANLRASETSRDPKGGRREHLLMQE